MTALRDMQNPPGNEENLKILRTKSLSGVVFESLEQAILSGEMLPGDRINETAVAERYGVSRGPVREACRRLEEAGMVDFVVNKGVFVKTLTLDDALEIYQIRATLFAFAGRILAKRLTDKQFVELVRLMEDVERAVEADDVEGCDAGNLAFHSALVEFTGYRRLVRLYDSMNRELNMFRRRSLGDSQNRREACVEHRGIIEALRKGDPTHAANVMWKHGMTGVNRVRRVMELSPGDMSRIAFDLDGDEETPL